MTVAAVAFCSAILLALAEGFGAPAFRSAVASDAIAAAMPFLGLLLVARFALRRWPLRASLVHRLHAAAQAMVAGATYGWWWIEPHAMLDSVTGGSLAAIGWAGLAGAVFGGLAATIAERAQHAALLRETLLGAWAFVLVGAGRIYRAYDHVEAGIRLEAAVAIVAATVAATGLLYLLLRRREKFALALPALAPALASALLFAWTGPGPTALSTRDSILVIVVDTLRADIADGAFAPDRDAMPQLRRIAEAGTRFTQAVSPAPWTLPATVSLLSGWNPHRHRFGASASDWEVQRGDPAALFLPGAMRDAGYLTAAFLNNPYLRPWYGFGDGFYAMRPYHGRALDGVALALDWMQGHSASPSFVLLHLMDPHWPYDAPPGFGAPRQPCDGCDTLFWSQFGRTNPDERAELQSRYAAEVHYTDAMLGRLYDTLDAAGELEHRWLVVTSDHGEEFWEHGGFLHGHSLRDELLRVPLVVVPPKSAASASRGARVDVQVRLEDVAATLLDLAAADPRRAIDGASLLPLLSGAKENGVRVSVAGYVKDPANLTSAVRRPPWKAVVSLGSMTGNRLFSLADDAGERHDLLFDPSLAPARRAELASTFASLRAEPARLGLKVARRAPAPGLAAPEADTRRKLQSLGYAQ